MVDPPLLSVRGRTVPTDRTLVMGVVNASPESFSDGRADLTVAQRIEAADRLVDAGADVLDIGGQSAVTRQPEIDARLELERVLPIVEWLVGHRPHVLLSVDTYRPLVAEAVLEAGAAVINDVSGLAHPEVASLCAAHGAGLVVMHTAAAPKQRLQRADLYGDVVADVRSFLAERMAVAVAAGLPRESIVLDPGPDFTKTPHQTLTLLRRLDEIRSLGRPLLLALSRKDFIGALLHKAPRDRDAGTLAALAFLTASEPGCLVRVHDVAAARDTVRVLEALRGSLDIDPDYVLPDDLRHHRPATG